MAEFQGPVRWFNNRKGFGFLGREDGPDVFVHYSAIEASGYRSLKEGDVVEYDVVKGEKGPQAANVRPSSNGAAAQSASVQSSDVSAAP
jgi:CspA family cold shock protein